MKVYVPTLEELEKLQSFGVNIYNYILAKTIEAIIMEDIIYEETEMFEILDYLDYDPSIIYAICKMYPKRIKESLITSKDPILLQKLISGIGREDKSIYKIDDYLMNFDESILFEEPVINSTIDFIATRITTTPKYRFDYMGPNKLLDSIFGCEVPLSKVRRESYDNLIAIDPIYSVKLELDKITKKRNALFSNYYQVNRGISMFTSRYGLDESLQVEYQNKDIVNKPNEKVKKLIKVLEEHKKEHQY